MKFELKKIVDEDHQWLVELHNDPIVLHNITNPTPISFEDHLNWWNSIKYSSKEIRLIFSIDGNNVGFTKFYSIDKENSNCVLGADIHKNYRSKGYAKIMWSMMLDHCFYVLNLHRVSLSTASYNSIAIKVYESLGFKIEGIQTQSLKRNNKFYDQICMFMLKDMWDKKNES